MNTHTLKILCLYIMFFLNLVVYHNTIIEEKTAYNGLYLNMIVILYNTTFLTVPTIELMIVHDSKIFLKSSLSMLFSASMLCFGMFFAKTFGMGVISGFDNAWSSTMMMVLIYTILALVIPSLLYISEMLIQKLIASLETTYQHVLKQLENHTVINDTDTFEIMILKLKRKGIKVIDNRDNSVVDISDEEPMTLEKYCNGQIIVRLNDTKQWMDFKLVAIWLSKDGTHPCTREKVENVTICQVKLIE